MSIQKFQVKLYVANGDGFDVDKVIPVFHSFIREKKLPTMLIDVADYGHVNEGPGVVLIGYAVDFYIEQREGRVGLLVSRKRAFEGDTAAAIADTVKLALEAAVALEAEADLGIRFDLDEVLVRVNDRLVAQNDEASFAAIAPVVATAVGSAVGATVSTSREGESRDLLTIRLRGGKGSVGEARARVG